MKRCIGCDVDYSDRLSGCPACGHAGWVLSAPGVGEPSPANLAPLPSAGGIRAVGCLLLLASLLPVTVGLQWVDRVVSARGWGALAQDRELFPVVLSLGLGGVLMALGAGLWKVQAWASAAALVLLGADVVVSLRHGLPGSAGAIARLGVEVILFLYLASTLRELWRWRREGGTWPAAEPALGLGSLLRTGGPALSWVRVGVLCLAFAGYVGGGTLGALAFQQSSQLSPAFLVSQAAAVLGLTCAVALSFRLAHSGWLAALGAAILYAALGMLLSWAGLHDTEGGRRPPGVASSFTGALLLVGSLELSLRYLRPRWLALGAGAFVSSMSSLLVGFLLASRGLAPGELVNRSWKALLGGVWPALPAALLAAVLFAVTFTIGLRLPVGATTDSGERRST